MTDIDFPALDMMVLHRVSNDTDFLDAMVDLYNKDPIEYQLKMGQFRNQHEEKKRHQRENDTTPRCPHCDSTNIARIGAGERAVSIAVLGAFSNKINKSFKCKKCGYTW